MSVSVRIQAGGYTLAYCEGILTIDDLAKVNEALYSEVDPELSRYQILDISNVTEIDVTTEGIRRLASQDVEAAQRLHDVAIAVVAPTDLGFGLSRMWQAFSDAPGVTTSVFRDFPSAEEWILSLRRAAT